MLLAEDAEVNRVVTAALLQYLGYDVVEVGDGAAAVAAAASGTFDAVLMDCAMPVMDGFEATRRILALPPPVPPVLAMTASAANREWCRSAGMAGCLVKPLAAEALRAALAEALAGVAPAEVAVAPMAVEPVEGGILAQISGLPPAGQQAMREAVQLFLARAPGEISSMRGAAARGDSPALGFSAHGLKGSAAVVGAPGMHALCDALESAADAGDVAGAPALLDRLAEEFERVSRALAEVLAPAPGSPSLA